MRGKWEGNERKMGGYEGKLAGEENGGIICREIVLTGIECID